MDRDRIEEKVREYLERNDHWGLEGLDLGDGAVRDHLIHCGTEMILWKWDLSEYEPGGFVRAVVENDLEATFTKADRVNEKALKWYLSLLWHVHP